METLEIINLILLVIGAGAILFMFWRLTTNPD
jgi:hypothetical protein